MTDRCCRWSAEPPAPSPWHDASTPDTRVLRRVFVQRGHRRGARLARVWWGLTGWQWMTGYESGIRNSLAEAVAVVEAVVSERGWTVVP